MQEDIGTATNFTRMNKMPLRTEMGLEIQSHQAIRVVTSNFKIVALYDNHFTNLTN